VLAHLFLEGIQIVSRVLDFLAEHLAQPDEAWLLKNYDSATGGTARFAAPCVFDDPTPWSHVPARESIEVRAFAIFDS
jgi:hypothetical protein